jgi:hypothetical protein
LIIKIPTSKSAGGVQLDPDETDRANCLKALRRLRAARGPLYAALSDEQKNAADQVMPSPMG